MNDPRTDAARQGTAGRPIRIGRVTPDRTEAVARLMTRFFREEGFAVPPEGLAPRLREYVLLPHHAVFAAHTGDRLVGAATVTSNYGLEYAWAAELEDLYVLPEHRGRGVARGLVAAAASWAREEGCTVLLVTVTPEGQQAHDLVGFYGRLGFVDEGRKILELDLRGPTSPGDGEQPDDAEGVRHHDEQ